MTDDIVARLRDTHPNFDEKPMCEDAADEIERLQNVQTSHSGMIFQLLEHARKQVEEIERLRATLRDIERINDSPGRTHQAIDEVIVAAFAGEKTND